MFSESAGYYDLLYSTIRDYAAESAAIATLLRDLNPAGRTVLDVGCGTGEHARRLTDAGFLVDGLDLDPAFVRLAHQKCPSGRFVEADMSDFDVQNRYDAVICLFSSIGYLKTLNRVEDALGCFRNHLAPAGVIVVEPWFAPDMLTTGRVVRNVAQADAVRVERVSRAEVQGRLSRLFFDYQITEGGSTREAHEQHELGLFTASEMIDTFRRALLSVKHDPVGITGRGLYIARARG